MTNNVVPIPVRSMASTAAGSVLSRTVREGAPKLVASTWGARLDPPMPHTTTRVNPSRCAASAKRVRSSHCANDARGASIQPRRLIRREKHNQPSPPVTGVFRLAHEASSDSPGRNSSLLGRCRRPFPGGDRRRVSPRDPRPHHRRGRAGRGGPGGRRRPVPRVEPRRSPLRQGAGARGRDPDALPGGFARRHGRRRAPPGLVMDAVPDAIAVLDRDGRGLDLNESAKRLLAAPPNAGAGRSVFASPEADAAATVRERLAAAFRGEVQRFEVAGRREDGTKGLSAMLYAPVRERGEVTRVLALGRDITDQKHTEHQLQQAEKLSAMGQLVSGVAHEINNPAAIISGFAQTLLLDVVKPEQREMLQMIYDEATRIGRITANLLAFARAGGSQRTLVDLNDIVRRTFALRSYHLTTLNIAVTLELSPAEPKFWADPSELP